MDKIPLPSFIICFDARNVNFELICVVVKIKSRRTHPIKPPPPSYPTFSIMKWESSLNYAFYSVVHLMNKWDLNTLSK